MVDSRRRPRIEVVFYWDGAYTVRGFPVPDRESALKWAERKMAGELRHADRVEVREWVRHRGDWILCSAMEQYRHTGVWQRVVT